MPLTVKRRPGHDGWWIEGTVTPAGARQGVRIRRRAGSDSERAAREEAVAYEAQILRDHHLGERPADHTWAEAVTAYIRHEPRSVGTLDLLHRLTRHFGDAPLGSMNQEAVNRARDVVLRPNAKPGTVLRNVIVPVRAVLSFAADMGWCAPPRIRAPRQPAGRTPRVLPAEFEALRDAMTPRHRPLLTWLICTGCRRGETRALDWADVDLGGATARLWADTTKAGKARVVKLPPACVAALATLPGRTGPVFGDVDIRSAWRRACRDAGVSLRGVHDLRHAWASYFYTIHNDLVLLKETGGWSSTSQVERYVHLVPSGNDAAILRLWGLPPRRQQRGVDAIAS